jgi:hypothetical protein
VLPNKSDGLLIFPAWAVLPWHTHFRPVMNGKNLFNFGPALGYFFRGNDPSRKTNFNLRTMHFINKLSMAMFLVGLCVLLYRWFLR